MANEEKEKLDRLTIAGCSGAGKSVLARALLFRRRGHRRGILDVEDEYDGAAEDVARTRGELHALLTDIREKDPESFSVRYVPEPPEVNEETDDDAALKRFYSRECGWFLRWMMSLGKVGDPIVAVVDEAHESMAQNFASSHSVRFAKKARKRGGLLWTISQRPSDVTTSIRSELSSQEAWFMRLVDHNDLQFLRAFRGKEFEERVSRLPNFHALRVVHDKREPELWATTIDGRIPKLYRIK